MGEEKKEWALGCVGCWARYQGVGLGTRMGLPAVGGWRTALEGSVPLSPRTDAVFAELARDLVREERAAVLVDAGLGASR